MPLFSRFATACQEQLIVCHETSRESTFLLARLCRRHLRVADVNQRVVGSVMLDFPTANSTTTFFAPVRLLPSLQSFPHDLLQALDSSQLTNPYARKLKPQRGEKRRVYESWSCLWGRLQYIAGCTCCLLTSCLSCLVCDGGGTVSPGAPPETYGCRRQLGTIVRPMRSADATSINHC